jgi:hypothetical protein
MGVFFPTKTDLAVKLLSSYFIKQNSPMCLHSYITSERQIPDLAKLVSSSDQINLYFIQLIIFIWQFCGTY